MERLLHLWEIEIGVRERVEEAVRKTKIELAVRALERVYRPSVGKVSLGRLKEVRRDLEEDPGKNLCLAFNHIAYSDPLPVLWLYYKYIDPKGERCYFTNISLSYGEQPLFCLRSQAWRICF